MDGRHEKLNSRGFTLTEVLAVAAVLAIAAALAIPALVKNWRSAKLTKWDETAREIYLSAQNETSEAKAAGLLLEISQEASDDASSGTTVQLTSSSDVAGSYFSQTRALLSAAGGSYVLALNLLNGDVEEVYYSEEERLTTADVEAMTGGLASGVSVTSVKNDAVRYAAGIGYYGGRGGSADDRGASAAIQPECTVENKEDLYVKLTVSGLGKAAAVNEQLISASVKVQGESHTVDGVAKRSSQTFTAGGSEEFSEINQNLIASTAADGTYTLYVLLDSMYSGKSFGELCPNLIPGDDLTLSLTLKVGGETLLADRTFAKVNSLFAVKDVDGTAVTAAYGYVRQLHNLAAYCNDARRGEISDTKLTLYQTQDVDFTDMQSAGDAAFDDAPAVMPGNSAADSYVSAAITGVPDEIVLDGGGHTLKNFKISGTETFAGLVGFCRSPLTLKNLRVADPNVLGTENAGVLAGKLAGAAEISNCRVYLTPQATTEKMRDWMKAHTVKSKYFSGGLLGNAENGSLTVQNSFAALPVSAENTAGGLIGAVSGETAVIRNSYASGEVTAVNATAGGMLGSAERSVLSIKEKCFTTSNVSAETFAGAMIGAISGGSAGVTGCSVYGLVATDQKSSYGPITGSGSAVLTDCDGLYQSGNAEASNRYEAGVSAKEFDDLKQSGGGKTYPYLMTGTFPFAFLKNTRGQTTVTIPYYGDWPKAITPVSRAVPYGLCYYERYSDGTWGFYGYDSDGSFLNTLDDKNTKSITDTYGYGVAAPVGANNVTGPKKANGSSVWGNSARLAAPQDVSNTGIQIYPLQDYYNDLYAGYMQNSTSSQVYDTVARKNYWINLLFAAALSESRLPASEDSPIQVRTAEQLQNLDRFRSGRGEYFRQTHNIQVSDKTIGRINADISYTYDGGSNWIDGLRQPLFGTIGSTAVVRNVVLRDVRIQDCTYSTGALAATARHTVTNCSVLSGSISVASGCNAAGLIEETQSGSVITNCTASCDVTAQGGTASGLIGLVQGSIVNCSVTDSTLTTLGAAWGTWAGGLISRIQSSAWVRDSHVSHVQIAAEGVAAGLIGKAGGTVTNCYASDVTINESGSGSGYTPSAAGLIGESDSGLILRDCYAANSVIESERGNASGLISYVRGGSVRSCYANNTVRSAQANAAGFCASIQDGAHLYGCYSDGTVRAGNGDKDTASGFFLHGGYSGSVYGCYSVARISGGTISVGFGDSPQYSHVSNCYWGKESVINASVSSDTGTACTLLKLRDLLTLDSYFSTMDDGNGNLIWTMDNQSHTHSKTLSGSYPYPRLAGLDHYGDWPVPSGTE